MVHVRAAGLALLAALGCQSRSAVNPALAAPRPVLVANGMPGELTLPADSAGASSRPPAAAITLVAKDVPGTLWVVPRAVELAPPAGEGAIAGPPADAIAELAGSLTPQGRLMAPPAKALPFYDLAVHIEPESGRLNARVILDYPNPGPTPLSRLPFRLFANAQAQVVSIANASSPGRFVKLLPSGDPTVAAFALEPPLPVGGWLQVAYDVTATVPLSQVSAEAALASALQSEPSKAPDYGLLARFAGGIALADWLPLVAARWEGGFDEGPLGPVGDSAFADVADFRATVDLPFGYVLVAPGAVLGEELSERRTRTRLALAAGRDFALFASKNYRVAEAREGSTRVRAVYESGHGAEGQAVLSAARHALARCADKLGAFPWTQFSAVEVPLGGGAGGAEFSGLVAIAGMFFRPAASVGFGLTLAGPFLADMREFTVTHEVAHQWWAIQVGNHPRLEPDVDEPLAQATAALLLGAPSAGAKAAAGRRDASQVFNKQVAVNYQAMRMLGGEDGPAARATSEFETTAVYAGLVYGKAPLFYEALYNELGEGPFWDALAAYAKAHRFGIARRGDVIEAFVEAGARRPALEVLYAHWFGEDHGDVDLAGRGDPLAGAGDLFAGDPASRRPNAEGDDPLEQAGDVVAKAREALKAMAAGQGEPQLGEHPLIDPSQAQQLLKQLDSTLGGAELPPADPSP